MVIVLTVAVCAAILALAWFGYYSRRQWQKSSALLVERWAEDSADLLVTAVRRDMRGAQLRVLANRDSGVHALESVPDFTDQTAEAFARYPYPESFFSWPLEGHASLVFFNRADRQPPWTSQVIPPSPYPVVVARNRSIGSVLLEGIDDAAAARQGYAVFETLLAGVPYQVVARLEYADPFRTRLASVSGFTVNLFWVRQRYFSEVLSQVPRVADGGVVLDFSVLDDAGVRVAGSEGAEPAAAREFALQFFDPTTAELPDGESHAARAWQVRVSAGRDPTLIFATRDQNVTVLVIAATTLGLALSLFFTARAVRASASISVMRSEFVSTVTHELKTPLATIRAVGDRLLRGRVTSEDVHSYARLLVQEGKRLTRLVDNLLAYARVTDVTQVYSFEPLNPAELVEEALSGFHQQFADRAFDVVTDIPESLPSVRGDRTALHLAIGNLIDNAIRYSGDNRWISVTAERSASHVVFEVRDRGIGIPIDEIDVIKQRFVRGRLAPAGGSGLGLAIVSRVAADHRGTLDLESEVGVGTKARLAIPIHEG